MPPVDVTEYATTAEPFDGPETSAHVSVSPGTLSVTSNKVPRSLPVEFSQTERNCGAPPLK